MKEIYTSIEEGKILISLRKEFYEKSAVLAAAHKMSGRFAVVIESIDDKTVGIILKPKAGSSVSDEEIKEAAADFCNEALDQQVRIDIEKRYGALRELIVKQAFSPVSLTELADALDENNG